MDVATGLLAEMRTLIDETRKYLAQAEEQDPFTRDDTLQYAARNMRSAWAVYNRLGIQISRVPLDADRQALFTNQSTIKAELEAVGALVDGAKVLQKSTGFSPMPAAQRRDYYASHMAGLLTQEDELQRAEVQVRTAVEQGAGILSNLQAQKETIEHAKAGDALAEEAFYQGIAEAKHIKRVADKHGLTMTILLSVLGAGIAISFILRLTLKTL